ncbi:putative efflux pump membrane fusion protein [Thiorhodovibrio litoralis]|nr:putative efflux pump membrane fusion protein [Thiorhodovibrio litoralis]
MPGLRRGVLLKCSEDSAIFQVRDPASGKVFEFGEEEAFLIEALQRPYDPETLMAEFRARFGREEGMDAFEELLSMLKDWGLLNESQEQAPPIQYNDVQNTPSRLGKSRLAAPLSGEAQSGQPRKGDSQKTETATEESRKLEATRLDLGEELQGEAEESAPAGHWHILRPERISDALLRVMSPFRFALWLIPVLLFYSVVAVWLNRDLVADSLATARLQFGLLGHLVFMAVTVNLSIQVMRAVVGRHFGLDVPSFGLVLAFGLIPRFNAQILLTPDTNRSQRMWLSATPLLVRMVLFSLGTTLWLAMRPSGSLLSIVGAKLAFVAAISFLLAATPLWSSDGYRFLANYSRIPNLHDRAKSALRGLIFGRPRVVGKYIKDSPTLALFGAASIAFPALLIALVATILARRLESSYQGAGVALFLVLFAYVTHHFLRQRSHKGRSAPGFQIAPMESTKSGVGAESQSFKELRLVKPQVGASGASGKGIFSLGRRYLLPIFLFACLFLPYAYEVGGDAVILPFARHEVYPDREGIVEQVFFNGGEMVDKGTVIAVMANHRQQKDVLATEAAVNAKKYEIDRLRTTPSAEAIRLAEKQLDIARLELQYNTDKADRIARLFENDSVSVQNYEDAKRERDIASEKVAENLANLDALKAQVNPNEIAAAQAELEKLQEELSYFREELRRTYLRMPITGRIVTLTLQNLRSKYLAEGELFAVVEDTRTVRVEISVPEADISDVHLGSKVRFKAWMNPYQGFSGAVTEIAPDTTMETYGPIVTVVAMLPNPDESLKTGMSGYAKIEAGQTLVIIAFTKALVRFFLIELWSWLP